jgi:hypothetical protein
MNKSGSLLYGDITSVPCSQMGSYNLEVRLKLSKIRMIFFVSKSFKNRIWGSLNFSEQTCDIFVVIS